MPKIRIDREIPIINGQTLTFQAPADCSQITGLVIYYPEGDATKSMDFQIVDAHGVDVGSGTISLFAANALVKVVLDTDQGKAFVQNADTNAYLEKKLAEKYSPNNKPSPGDIGAASASDLSTLRTEFDALKASAVSVLSGTAAPTASQGSDGDIYLVTG